MTNRLELNWKVDGFVDEQRYYCSGTPIDPENLPAPKAILSGDVRSYIDTNIISDQTYFIRLSSIKNGTEKLSTEIIMVTQKDEYIQYVVTLIHFLGEDKSTTIIDIKNKHWLTYGNAKISKDQSKFGNTSLFLDGNGDYVSTPHHADFNMGAEQFTIECWARLSTLGTPCFFSKWSATLDRSWALFIPSTNQLCFRFWDGALIQDVMGAWVPSLNTWHHLAVSKDSNNMIRVFVDGVSIASAMRVEPVFNSTREVWLGGARDFPSLDLNGYIDEFRYTKGIGRYQAEFIPPSMPFSDK